MAARAEIEGWLRRLRDTAISVEEFRVGVVPLLARPDASISRGLQLKLQYGDFNALLSVARALVPSCDLCNSVHASVEFATADEFEMCARSVDAAEQRHVLARVQRSAPSYDPFATRYTCRSCGALWTLADPDREVRGYWRRLA